MGELAISEMHEMLTCIFNQKGWQQQGLRFCFQGLQVRTFALEHHSLLPILLQASFTENHTSRLSCLQGLALHYCANCMDHARALADRPELLQQWYIFTSQDASQGTPLTYMLLYRPTAACAHCAAVLPLLIFSFELTTRTACKKGIMLDRYTQCTFPCTAGEILDLEIPNSPW